jgi:hypothetical protein
VACANSVRATPRWAAVAGRIERIANCNIAHCAAEASAKAPIVATAKTVILSKATMAAS